jgi:predicted transcriptional regulator
MAAQSLQISLDSDLLRRIDADPEAREAGRSAFIHSAIQLYLAAKERRAIDEGLERAYTGQADVLLDEVSDLLCSQAWPTD